MSFSDFETIYALGLDDVLTGEREPSEEEQELLLMIGAGAPNFDGSNPSAWLKVLCAILGVDQK